MDARIEALSPWQQIVYKLCWTVGAGKKDDQRVIDASAELNRMAKERPDEYEAAFEVWTKIMYEVLY